MTDIYPIKDVLIHINWLVNIFVILIFLIIFYFLSPKKENKKAPKIPLNEILKKDLQNLENQLFLPRHLFYSKLFDIACKKDEKLKKLNLSQLEKVSPILKEIYLKIYDKNQKDDENIRKQLINEVKKFIQ